VPSSKPQKLSEPSRASLQDWAVSPVPFPSSVCNQTKASRINALPLYFFIEINDAQSGRADLY
jgi:hypothetical protein